MRPVATRKRRGTSIDFDLDKQPNRRETAKRRFGAGFKRKSACPSRAPGHVLGMFLFQGAWPCLLRRHPGGAPFFSPAGRRQQELEGNTALTSLEGFT